MKESITTEEIFTRLSEERKTGELLPLGHDIYQKAAMEGGDDKSEDSLRREENKKKLLGQLRTRRLQKILTYIAYGRSLPHPIPEEEERLYIRIKKIIDEENSDSKDRKVRILTDTPEIITTEGRKLGPFGKNTIINIENQGDLEFLIKNKIGETTK